jgi:hypothetical protein
MAPKTSEDFAKFHEEISNNLHGNLSPKQVAHLRDLLLGGKLKPREVIAKLKKRLANMYNAGKDAPFRHPVDYYKEMLHFITTCRYQQWEELIKPLPEG